ncbi:MAG: hypothetical protein CW691_11595 [Candidatus Bathyarchaeum sp.]|nr:MAG: hypothetical protein CW691_11595 [Candidatus Bathyarchaeum sp.]
MPLDKVTVKRSKKDEKAVRENYVKRLRDNYLLILRTLMHDLIVSIDKDGNFVFVNDAADEFWNKSNEKIVGTHFAQYIHPDDVKKALSALQDLIENKNQVKGFVVRMKSPTGFRRVAWNGIAIFDADGNYVGAQATGKDITDLLRAEEELKQSKQHFRRLFEVMVDPIVIVDMAGKILEFSHSAEEILGFTGDELVGKSFLETDAATAESKDLMKKNLEKLKKGMYIAPHIIKAVTNDGKKLLYELNPARIVYKGEPAILAIFHDVTGLKNAEEKFQASEERFKRLVDNAPEAIWVQDVSGTFLDGNKRAEELTGYKRKELLGKNLLDLLVRPENVPVVMEAFKANMLGEFSGPVELEMVKKGGTLVTVEASTIPVKRDGKIEIIGITRDITDRKKAEQALQESEEKYRELSELLPEVVFETDVNGKLTIVNDVAFDRFGYSREDFDNRLNAFQMLVPEDRNRAKSDFAKVLGGTDVGFIEYAGLRKDGSTFPIMIHSTRILQGNKPVGLRGLIIDITDRKKAEEALKESEKRFRNTLDNMLEGCQIIDYDWRYAYINDAAAKHARLSPKILLGKTMMEVYPGLEETTLFPVLNECMEKRVPAHLENEFTYPKGEKAWFELSIEPVPEGIFILSIDISDRKEIAEALRQEREMLETVTANINATLSVISKDYRILWANKVLKHRLGKEIEGATCYSALNYRKSICPKCGVQEIFETGKDLVITEQKISTPTGPIWVELTVAAIRDENGEIVAASEMGLNITERKKLETELKASVQKFRTIFEGATNGILAVDPETKKFVFANPRMYEITGYSFGELTKLGMADIVPKDGLAFALDQFKKQLEGKITVSRSVPVLRKDKTVVYCDVSSRLMKIGNEQYMIGFFRDVTEQKKAEEALRASEEKYRELINGMNDTAIVIDFDGKIIDANKTAVEVLGYSREELLSSGPEKFDTALTLEQIRGLVEKLKTKRLLVFETEHTTKDGKPFPVEVSSSRVTYQGKEAIVSIARDITERKKAEEALRQSEENYRAILNSMNDTVWVIDFDGKFVDMNDKAVNLLGYSREELLSMGPQDLSKDMPEAAIKELIAKLPTDGRQIFEALHFPKDGKPIPVEISSTLVTYQGKSAILSIARDITERKKAEEVIDEAMRLLKQSNTELESYTYVVSHDLKAPLRTIKSFGTFILEDYADKLDETGQDYLNRMVNASSRMDSMIEDLLILSRVGRKFTEFEKVDLNKLLNEILGDLEAAIKETKTKVVVDKLPVISGQRVWMRQLFMNLISNALKFNESKTPKIEVLHEEREKDHLFKVRDNGIGIEEKYLTRIFNLFERAPTEKKYDGTGAGLSICKKIVEHLEGKIWVESTPGKGSTFFFTIPKQIKKEKEK